MNEMVIGALLMAALILFTGIIVYSLGQALMREYFNARIAYTVKMVEAFCKSVEKTLSDIKKRG
nr:MAG TPA: hypothetical protein [Caudoviricetes sp.]